VEHIRFFHGAFQLFESSPVLQAAPESTSVKNLANFVITIDSNYIKKIYTLVTHSVNKYMLIETFNTGTKCYRTKLT